MSAAGNLRVSTSDKGLSAMKLITSIILTLFLTLIGYSTAYGGPSSTAAQERAKLQAELIKKKRAAQIRDQRLRVLNERKKRQQIQRAINERNRKLQQLRLLNERKKRLQKLREKLRKKLREEQRASDNKQEKPRQSHGPTMRCVSAGSGQHPVSPACRNPKPNPSRP